MPSVGSAIVPDSGPPTLETPAAKPDADSSFLDELRRAVGEDGERVSIFAPGNDGVPRLITVLMARHVEEAGGLVDGVRGMPLGLEALPYEDINLVYSWIEQGRPQD